MYKLAEKLFDKYLYKMIYDISYNLCALKFDETFKECCETNNIDNPTLWEAHKRIAKMATEKVNTLLGSKIEEMDSNIIKATMKCEFHPLNNILYSIWDDFKDQLSKDWIENAVSEGVSDSYREKEKLLYDNGIIDEHGDFRSIEEVTRG